MFRIPARHCGLYACWISFPPCQSTWKTNSRISILGILLASFCFCLAGVVERFSLLGCLGAISFAAPISAFSKRDKDPIYLQPAGIGVYCGAGLSYANQQSRLLRFMRKPHRTWLSPYIGRLPRALLAKGLLVSFLLLAARTLFRR